MSYDISFRVKAEGIDYYVDTNECDANITWNVRDIITKSTGLEWKNEDNNGYVKDIIPYIEKGLKELKEHPEKYRKYEPKNKWGTVESTIGFFESILKSWENVLKYSWNKELVDVMTFWIT